MLKRQKQVTVRFTEEEYHQLKNKCDAAGMKMGHFSERWLVAVQYANARRIAIKPWQHR